MRAVIATLTLSVVGALAGAVVGISLLPIVVVRLASADASQLAADASGVVAAIGAVCGGVALPLSTWVLLRAAPVSHVLGWLTVGTVVGGLVASVFHPFLALYGAVVGCIVGAVSLRRGHRALTQPPSLSLCLPARKLDAARLRGAASSQSLTPVAADAATGVS